jgi:DNA end-binding protein Ku
MRSIWRGSIAFGLVSIPVRLYSATERKDIRFHQVHRQDGGRVRFERVCAKCGRQVPYSEIAKGCELPSGEIVMLTDEDFAKLPLPTRRRIEVLLFAPTEQVDPIYFEKPYYLEPEAQGTKPYVLLRDAMDDSGKVGVAKVAIRQRESLATVRVRGGVFVVETMLWPDEVREPDFGFLREDVDVRPQEMQMAFSLIETMAGAFDPTQYEDRYREALEELIQAKLEGRRLLPPQPQAPPPPPDLLGALRASVEAARKRRPTEKEQRRSTRTRTRKPA